MARTRWQRFKRWWHGRESMRRLRLEKDKRTIIRLIAMAEVEKERCDGALKIKYINLIRKMRFDLSCR